MFKLRSLFVSAILFTAAIFSLAAEQDNHTIRAETIFQTSTHFYHQVTLPTSLLVMEDGSIWEVLNPPMIKRLPDSEDPPFCFRLTDWEKPMHVGIEHLSSTLALDYFPEDYIKREKLGEFPYIIVNLETNKFAYARPLEIQQVIDYFLSYAKGEYEIGYAEGNFKAANE